MLERLLGKNFTLLLLKLVTVLEKLTPVVIAYLQTETQAARVGMIAEREAALIEALEVGREGAVSAMFDALDRDLDVLLSTADATPPSTGAERGDAQPQRDVDGDSGVDGTDAPQAGAVCGSSESAPSNVIGLHVFRPLHGPAL
tara:strand:+ start:7336 stop:7767 length:432 start_codon:yes stop_codon:yes gene_type:complete